MSVTGYMHEDYAFGLIEVGTPQRLARSGGWILVSPIGAGFRYDARGCYPLFACRDWSRLSEDLESVSLELVSLVMVADPFGDLIEMLFEIVRPEFKRDGGDIRILDYKDKVLRIEFLGGCRACLIADMVEVRYLEYLVRKYISEDILIENVKETAP